MNELKRIREARQSRDYWEQIDQAIMESADKLGLGCVSKETQELRDKINAIFCSIPDPKAVPMAMLAELMPEESIMERIQFAARYGYTVTE